MENYYLKMVKNPSLLQELHKNPRKFLTEFGFDIPHHMHMELWQNGINYIYFVIPFSNFPLIDDELSMVIAAKNVTTVSSASSGATLSSYSSSPSSHSTLSTASSIGTLGTVVEIKKGSNYER